MAKGALIGFVIGIVVASVSFKVIERRSRTTERTTTSTSTSTIVETHVPQSSAETAVLRRRVRELEEEIATLQGRPVRREESRGASRSWKGLAAKMLAARERIRGRQFGEWPSDAKSLELELIAMVSAIGEADGLTLDETIRSPQGLPALLVEMVAESEEERHRLAAVLEGSREKWTTYVEGRERLTRLEQKLAMFDLNDATMGALLGALSPAQSEIAKSIPLFDLGSDEGPSTWTEGSREKVASTLLESWTASLKLDSGSAGALRPVVEDYMRRFQEMQSAFWKRRQSGEDVPRREEALARLTLMIETHRRVSGAVPLTPEQTRALREWSTIYGCNVHD